MADAQDLGSCAERRAGSSPVIPMTALQRAEYAGESRKRFGARRSRLKCIH